MTPASVRNAALKADLRLDAYFSGEVARRQVTRDMFDRAAAGYDAAELWTGFGTGLLTVAADKLLGSGSRADAGRLWKYYGGTFATAIEPARILDALGTAGFSDVRCTVSMGIFRESLADKP